jgi:hypothetical protein
MTDIVLRLSSLREVCVAALVCLAPLDIFGDLVIWGFESYSNTFFTHRLSKSEVLIDTSPETGVITKDARNGGRKSFPVD